MKKALAATAVVLGVLLAAPAAQASANACGDDLSQPFLPWGDEDFYSLVPGGDFETGAPGWELGGDAELVEEGAGAALALTPKAVATSPPICVTEEHVSARMFGRSADADGAGRVRVKVLYGDGEESGNERLSAGSEMAPLDSFDLGAEHFELDPATGTGEVRLRLRVNGGEHHAIVVDDVYVDPRRRS